MGQNINAGAVSTNEKCFPHKSTIKNMFYNVLQSFTKCSFCVSKSVPCVRPRMTNVVHTNVHFKTKKNVLQSAPFVRAHTKKKIPHKSTF